MSRAAEARHAAVLAALAVGQLVEVRRRPFVVQDVVTSRLPRAALDAPLSEQPQYLVTLSSVEDDAPGEKLQHLHIEMDQAVSVAYGWHDLDLRHGFHEMKRALRICHDQRAGAARGAQPRAVCGEGAAGAARQGAKKPGKRTQNGRSQALPGLLP